MNGALEFSSWLAAQWGAAMLNSLAPGLLLALLGWGVLKALPRLNASTRFALGLSLLAAVALLPVLLSIPAGRGAISTMTATMSALQGEAGSIAWPGWLETAAALVWLCGSLLLALRLVIACRDLVSLRRSCRPVEPEFLAALDLPLHGRARRARICLSGEVSSPLAIGFWRPLVVLPAEMPQQCDADDLRRVLLHELEHIRRGDDWTHVAQQVLLGVLFFQPAAWWLNRFLTEEREAACDDAVLAATGEARGYAVCLARLAESGLQRRLPAWAAGAVSRPSLLRRRVVRILQNGRDVSGHLSRPALAVAVAGAVLVLTAAARLPRLVAPQPVTWPAVAGLPSLHPQWEAQRAQAVAAMAKAEVDEQAAATLRQGARLRLAAAREKVAVPRPSTALAELTDPRQSQRRVAQHEVSAAGPATTEWRFVEVQSVQWNTSGQVTTTRMVFVVTGPQAARMLQNPPPILF